MKIYHKLMLVPLLVVCSCADLSEINKNPNEAVPTIIDSNLILPTVLTESSKEILNLGFGKIGGVVQHTQLDAWFSEHNDYDWISQSWSPYYKILKTNQLLYERATEMDQEFHQGVSLIMKSLMFGLITDLWGDAPYSEALKGDLEGASDITPVFDDQQTIYAGIIADLEQANTLLSKEAFEYSEITDAVKAADVIYEGDPAKWRMMANSLMLRYYMRLSAKQPDVAKAGVQKIMASPATYPLITDNADDATMGYAGNNSGDSWPSNAVYDASGSNYRRIKMCATLVETLQAYNDPRLGVWANRVQVPLVIDAGLPPGSDNTTDGVRYLSPDEVEGETIDQDPDYVGIPASSGSIPSAYNHNATPGQTSYNLHVSYLNDIYADAEGPLLKARIISAAEVHFILAEAAFYGWIADAETHYNAGIDASLSTWGVADASYKNQPEVKYTGELEQIMTQKWIASWTAATEAWFDYRRTALPDFQVGPSAKRAALPVRFYYMQEELNLNGDNAAEALGKLKTTSYSQADGANSAWSKPWLIQDTGKPWN